MESAHEDKAALISGIEADARDEAKRIIAEAEEQAEEKRKYAQKKADALIADAQKRGQAQAETILKRAASAADLEVRRRFMALQSQAVKDILDRVEDKLRSMIKDDGYTAVLKDWIVEAAIGLDVEAAEISTSQAERGLITETLLTEVAAEVAAVTGKPVRLKLSEGRPLSFQGVILTAENGRIAFNNQVKTRMSRNERQIRRRIHAGLFTDNPKE